jgi:hypothetical protein
MVRAYEPLGREVKKIDIRRKQEEKKRELEGDLILARNIATQQELTNAQVELDQTQKSKDIIETNINEATVREENFILINNIYILDSNQYNRSTNRRTYTR